jgi:hypothetical protein
LDELSGRFGVETLPPVGSTVGFRMGGLVFQELAQNAWGWDRFRAGIPYKDNDGRVIGLL